MSAEPVIAIENASKHFLDGAVVAFRQLSLAAARNEILCIVGPSGCGKTTLLRCIAGLTEISAGRLLVQGKPVDGLASVASFFVSRVDGKVDAALEKAGRSDLQGKAAIANARVAYESFQRIFSGPRWEALAARGARVQKPLWASTSTKNPAYPDTLYVDELIGPDTVNTMPDQTIDAARYHGTARRTIDRDVPGAHRLLDQVRAAGVDIDRICAVDLVEEGVAAFAKAFNDLIETIGSKSAALATAGASADG